MVKEKQNADISQVLDVNVLTWMDYLNNNKTAKFIDLCFRCIHSDPASLERALLVKKKEMLRVGLLSQWVKTGT